LTDLEAIPGRQYLSSVTNPPSAFYPGCPNAHRLYQETSAGHPGIDSKHESSRGLDQRAASTTPMREAKSTTENQPSTIGCMDGLTQQSPAREERDSSRRIIAAAVVIVLALAVGIALLLRGQPKSVSAPPRYAAYLKLSDFKMSAAENFVGASVSYIDGTITNAGDKTVTHAMVDVIFKDDMGQMAQREDVPLKVLKTGGPYPEAVDLSISPLAPSQTQPFRLTFESISMQWNHQYPEIRITDVALR
jgi:hypothetical protein